MKGTGKYADDQADIILTRSSSIFLVKFYMTNTAKRYKIRKSVSLFVFFDSKLLKRFDMSYRKFFFHFRLVYSTALANMVITTSCFVALRPPVRAIIRFCTTNPVRAIFFREITSKPSDFAFVRTKTASMFYIITRNFKRLMTPFARHNWFVGEIRITFPRTMFTKRPRRVNVKYFITSLTFLRYFFTWLYMRSVATDEFFTNLYTTININFWLKILTATASAFD